MSEIVETRLFYESVETRLFDDWLSPWVERRFDVDDDEFLESLTTRNRRRPQRYPVPERVYSLPVVGAESRHIEPPTWGNNSVAGFIQRRVQWWPTYTEDGAALCVKPA